MMSHEPRTVFSLFFNGLLSWTTKKTAKLCISGPFLHSLYTSKPWHQLFISIFNYIKKFICYQFTNFVIIIIIIMRAPISGDQLFLPSRHDCMPSCIFIFFEASLTNKMHDNLDPFYYHGLTVIPAWIGKYMPSKEWNEINYPFPNFNCV